MFKIFLCLAVLISSTLVGKSFTDKYGKRLSFYSNLKNFNLNLKQNVKFNRKDLLDILDYKTNDEDFNCFIQSYKVKLLGRFNRDLFMPKWATEEDSSFLLSYVDGIGKNGLLSELDFINSYEELITEKLSEIKENAIKFSKLGQKLGFAVGACLVVIII